MLHHDGSDPAAAAWVLLELLGVAIPADVTFVNLGPAARALRDRCVRATPGASRARTH